VAEVHHFEYGWVTPVFSYAVSVLGCLLGLVSTARARAATDPRRRAWLLVLAAWAIGGTGIWVMHFIAMIGFAVPNAPLRYDVSLTVASFLIAVLVVGVGLFIVGFGRPSLVKLLTGGLVTGVSVAFMHYTGMAAMRLPGQVEYDRTLVLASYGIAIVAATVALWFTLVVRGVVATSVAAAIMGVAVVGMHYTGMAAMRVHLHDDLANVPGVNVNLFLAPILLFVLLVVIALAYVLMATPSTEEQAEAASLRRAMSGRAEAVPAASAAGTGARSVARTRYRPLR
jgi:NO-binding membrane sensor protein with MHYT domain